MKTKKLKSELERNGTRRWAVPSALVLASLALVGCGGGSGSSQVSLLSGNVIDGYIEGAEVCLDLNNNQTCDTGEPKAITGKDGGYKLETTGLLASQIKAAHLLTNVPTTAKDADDGGKTLAEAGKSAFNLLAPASAYVKSDGSAVTGAVISPLTTLVSHEMITGNTPLTTAQSYVRTRLSLSDTTDLTQDFVAKKDATLIEKAQVLTAAIGEVKAQALKDTSTAASDKQALFAALQYLQTQVADLQIAVKIAKDANSIAKPVDWVKTAIATDAAKPAVADLVLEAKKTTDSSASSAIDNLLQAGFYGAQHILESCGTASSTLCIPSYLKVSGSNGNFTSDQGYSLSGSAWVKSNQNDDFRLSEKGWVSARCTGGTYTEDGTGGAVINCGGWAARVSAREVDASGKTLKALGLTVPSNYADTTPMPKGAKLYWFSFKNENDNYYIYTGNKVQQWSNSANAQVTFASLNDFIAANGAGTQGRSWSGLRFTFDADGTSTGGTVTLLDYGNWSSKTAIGKANYEIRTVAGQQVLVILKPAPLNSDGSSVMFAVKDGYVYSGDYRSAAMTNQREAYFNKIMMNAILQAGNKPAVLD